MKFGIKYGGIIAIILILTNTLFVDLMGLANNFVRMFSGVSVYIIIAIGLFVFMRRVKKETYANSINYGQAIYVGIVISVFTALFMAIYNFVYFQFLNPNYVNELVEVIKPLMQAEKLSAVEMDKEIVRLKESYFPVNQIKGTFILITLVGVLFSAIFSSIIRNQDTFTQITKPRS